MQPRLLSVINGDDQSLSAKTARAGLACLEPAYRTAIWTRNRLFDWHLRPARRLPRPVISVGNLTTGGTGKTPLIVDLARRIAHAGHRPAVLLRGYRANNSVSDEARLLGNELGHDIPVEPDPDRLAAARRALARHPDTDLFLLDDGFQHRQIHRDLDLVLIDATAPFGFGHVLPRGLLREPISSLNRAHAVIITRCDQVNPDALAALDQRIQAITARQPIAHTAHRWAGWRDQDDIPHPLDTLKPARAVGVCGIGNPHAFRDTLRQHCRDLLAFHALPDHHPYQQSELDTLLQDAQRHRADAVVTTDKDWVKWQSLLNTSSTPIPIYRPVLRIEWLDGCQRVDTLWRRSLSPPAEEKT